MDKFNKMINSDTPTLVDFTATWCGPCKVQSPILQEVAGQIGEKAHIIKVDIDKNPHAAEHYQVHGVPTLILFKKGVIKWRQSGVTPANMLLEVINKNIQD